MVRKKSSHDMPQAVESAVRTSLRFDSSDEPTPYNIDRYTVYVDMPSHQSFGEIVTHGSRSDNANLRQYMGQRVFIVKQDPGPDHWMAEPPSSATTLFKSS